MTADFSWEAIMKWHITFQVLKKNPRPRSPHPVDISRSEGGIRTFLKEENGRNLLPADLP